MAVNKVVYGDQTLIDLTGDTVTEDKILTGYTAHGKDGDPLVGTCDFDVNSEDATVSLAEMLTGKTAYARGVKLTGTMPNNGAVNKSISSKSEQISIQQGYHDGGGKIQINTTEQAKMIPGNIKQGVTILGVVGTLEPSSDVKAHSKTVTPSKLQQTVLPDEGFDYLSQVTVNAIPYVESDNSAGGTTVTIAGV